MAGRQLTRQDRDKDKIVDAENDLEQNQRREAQPCGRVSQPLHQLLAPPMIARARKSLLRPGRSRQPGKIRRSPPSCSRCRTNGTLALALQQFAFEHLRSATNLSAGHRRNTGESPKQPIANVSPFPPKPFEKTPSPNEFRRQDS